MTAVPQHAADARLNAAIRPLEWWLGDAVPIIPRLPLLDAAFSNFGALWFADPVVVRARRRWY